MLSVVSMLSSPTIRSRSNLFLSCLIPRRRFITGEITCHEKLFPWHRVAVPPDFSNLLSRKPKNLGQEFWKNTYGTQACSYTVRASLLQIHHSCLIINVSKLETRILLKVGQFVWKPLSFTSTFVHHNFLEADLQFTKESKFHSPLA